LAGVILFVLVLLSVLGFVPTCKLEWFTRLQAHLRDALQAMDQFPRFPKEVDHTNKIKFYTPLGGVVRKTHVPSLVYLQVMVCLSIFIAGWSFLAVYNYLHYNHVLIRTIDPYISPTFLTQYCSLQVWAVGYTGGCENDNMCALQIAAFLNNMPVDSNKMICRSMVTSITQLYWR
jgi:hypothetical protein